MELLLNLWLYIGILATYILLGMFGILALVFTYGVIRTIFELIFGGKEHD